MKSKSKPSTKKREDRTLSEKFDFYPVTIEAKTAETCKYLLASSDEDVIIKVLYALDKFAIKSPENLHVLYETDVVAPLLSLTTHTDLIVRRLAMKLLAQLCSLDKVKKFLLRDKGIILFFAEFLTLETDVCNQEFSSLILAELSSLPRGAEKVLNSGILDVLFKRLTSCDPDVQKNCLEIMKNILLDPLAGEAIIKIEDFTFGTLLELYHSEYPAIQQLAISVIEHLTRRTFDSAMQDMFRNENGIEKTVDVLEMFEWKDLHHNLLQILENVTIFPENADYINKSGCLQRLLSYMDRIHEPGLIEDGLSVIIKLANLENGCQILYDLKVTDLLITLLRDETNSVTTAACMGISAMCHYRPALDRLYYGRCIKGIFNIIRNENRPWKTRHAAAQALCDLMNIDFRFCSAFMELKKQDVFITLLLQPIAVETIILIVNILGALSMHEEAREKLGDTDLVQILWNFLKDDNTQLRITACRTLCGFVCESSIRNSIQELCIQESGGTSAIMDCLNDGPVPLQIETATLIQLLSSDSRIVPILIKIGILKWLLEQKSLRILCPNFETAIEAIFKNYLPAKFAYTNRLNVNDITDDIFYITYQKEEQFYILDDIILGTIECIPSIYMSNFNVAPKESLVEQEISSSTKVSVSDRKISKTVAVKKNPSRETEHVQKSNFLGVLQSSKSVPDQDRTSKIEAIASRASTSDAEQVAKSVVYDAEQAAEQKSVYSIPEDIYLQKYLEDIKEIISSSEATQESRVKLLADFVHRQMCGTDPELDDFANCLELHLNEIMANLGRKLIPLGQIRFGSYLERAMLFKLLADRIGLACTFVRGKDGRAWNEVAIPKDDPDYILDKAVPLWQYPKKLLRLNHVVDLVQNIGELLPIGSYEARKYCMIDFCNKSKTTSANSKIKVTTTSTNSKIKVTTTSTNSKIKVTTTSTNSKLKVTTTSTNSKLKISTTSSHTQL